MRERETFPVQFTIYPHYSLVVIVNVGNTGSPPNSLSLPPNTQSPPLSSPPKLLLGFSPSLSLVPKGILETQLQKVGRKLSKAEKSLQEQKEEEQINKVRVLIQDMFCLVD